MLVFSVVVSLATAGWECDYAKQQWAQAKLPAPCELKSAADAKVKWALTAEQAACAWAAIQQPAVGADESKRHAAWLGCAMKWPDAWALSVGVVRTWDATSDLSALVKLLPVDAATRLLDLDFTPRATLAASVVEREPARLLPLLEDRRLPADDRASLAWVALRAGKAPVDDARFLNALLVGPLRNGRLLFAAHTWLSLPAATRAKFAGNPAALPLGGDVAGGASRFEADGTMTPVIEHTPSLRPLLVLGLLALGEKDAAKAIVVPATETADAKPDDFRGPDLALVADAVTWMLTAKRTITAWDAALRMRTSHVEVKWEFWACVQPYLAPHDGLFRKSFGRRLKYERERPEKPEGAWAEALAAADAEGLALLQKRAPFTAPGDGDAKVEAPVAELPPAFPSPFTEEKPAALPPNAPVKLTREQQPVGFWPVRIERQGKRLVALSLSQRLDPVGEVSPGGYWLSVSSDAGAHWRHIYLSLGDHRPFVALKDSKIPLLDARDTVRLAMEEAPLNEKSITFPPIGMSAPTRRPLVVLVAKLADLERDTDEDGLTDLVEARLLLDWKNKDTDGDGVIDGDDATPRLDDRLKPTVDAEMLNAFFEEFLTGRRAPKAIVLSPQSTSPIGPTRAAELDDVRFLEGTPAALAGLRPLVRLINVAPDELNALIKRYGTFYPMHLELTVEGPDHAFLEWSERWRGGSVRIDRDADGRLVVTMLGEWIT